MTLSVDLIVKDEGDGFYSGVAPQFSGFLATAGGTAALQTALDNAEAVHRASYFTSTGVYEQAMANYAAHHLAKAYPQVATGTASGGSGTGAAATSLKAGDLQVNYGSAAVGGAAASGDDLDTTSWGQTYKRLRRSQRGAPRYITGR